MAGQFGLQPLISKSLAIVSDARFSGKDAGIVVERLLCISGEDTLTIDRKNTGSVTMRLPTRFTFLSNETPRLTESSGALAGRFLILPFTQSFYGREDRTLERRLTFELPGILRWAIAGWHLLQKQGRFVEPAASVEAREEFEDLLSPIGMWFRERCTVDPASREFTTQLFNSWKTWCAEQGRDKPGTMAEFGRLLATLPEKPKHRRNHLTGAFYERVRLGK